MTKDVYAFRFRVNALRLQAALSAAGIPSRVRWQGPLWVVFCNPEHHDAAYEVSLGTIYI